MSKQLPPEIVETIVNAAVAIAGYLVRMLQVFLTKKSKSNEKT